MNVNSKKIGIKWTLIVISLLLILLMGKTLIIDKQKNTKKEKFENQYYFLESELSLNIFDENINVDENELNSEIREKVIELEKKFTTRNKSSEVSKINQNAGLKPVIVSDETFNVIKKSIYYSNLSEGMFDVTIGDLVNLWGIDTDYAKVPSQSEIDAALSNIDYSKININEKTKEILLKDKGMKLDLGGIAKGYVVDEVKNILEKYKIKSAIINISGNVYVHGDKRGDYFKVGIRDPYGTRNDVVAIYKAKNETVVTSGVYERFFEENGKKYHHILSTKNGYPIENELQSVTIITKSSMDGDGFSTTLFALGLENGMKLANQIEGLDAIFITSDKKIYISDGVKGNVEIINDEYSKFTNI